MTYSESLPVMVGISTARSTDCRKSVYRIFKDAVEMQLEQFCALNWRMCRLYLQRGTSVQSAELPGERRIPCCPQPF